MTKNIGDDPDAAARQYRSKRRMESHVEVPHDWDTPVPELPEAKDEYHFVSISDDIESQLQREASSASLAKKYGSIGHRNDEDSGRPNH